MRSYTSSTIFPIPLLHIMLYCIAILIITCAVANAEIVSQPLEMLLPRYLPTEQELSVPVVQVDDKLYSARLHQSSDGSFYLRQFIELSCNVPTSLTCDGIAFYNKLPILPSNFSPRFNGYIYSDYLH